MPFGEEPGADNLPITIRSHESFPNLTSPLPPGRDRPEVFVREASPLGPDAGVEDPDDDVGAVVGFGPEAALDAEAEELRGAGGVEAAAAVGDEGEDGGVRAERGELGGCE